MRKLLDIFLPTAPLHHAYILVGDPRKVLTELNDFLEKRFGVGFTSVSNPDYSLRELSTWGMEESRELKAFNSHRPVSWPVKIMAIMPDIISFQAQNSLLKTLEEPTVGTHFFIITRRLEEYLPTVVSRCQVIKLETGIFVPELIESVEKWLSADIVRRFEINKDILKQQENKQTYVLDWLNCLLDIYWGKISGSPERNISSPAESIFDAISYVSQRGSSPRIILEHLSGIVPTV